MIRDCQGDLFASGAEALVNPVNCVGVAGKGLALEFKKRWPEVYGRYRRDCNSGWMRPGKLSVHLNNEGVTIIGFPTKSHWRDPSRLLDIQGGLLALKIYLKTYTVASVAIPALGCGLGGLDWADVRPLIAEALGGLDCDVMLYGPKEGDR